MEDELNQFSHEVVQKGSDGQWYTLTEGSLDFCKGYYSALEDETKFAVVIRGTNTIVLPSKREGQSLYQKGN